jgi:predicted secreted protein
MLLGIVLGLGLSIAASANDRSTTPTATLCARITVRPGKEFTIKLPTNASTGYDWDVENMPDDRVVAIDAVARYIPPNNNRLGASGEEVWHFTAVRTGFAVIALKYARWFDRPSRLPAKEAFYVVVVR